MQCSFYYIDVLMTAFLTIFQRFLTAFRKYTEIPQNLPEGRTRVAEHFSKIPEDYRKLSKTFEEGPKAPDTNEFKYNLRDKLDVSEIICIFHGKYATRVPHGV